MRSLRAIEVDERGDQAVLDERGLVRSARRMRARAKLGGIHAAERLEVP